MAGMTGTRSRPNARTCRGAENQAAISPVTSSTLMLDTETKEWRGRQKRWLIEGISRRRGW
jgi:hypothetical protein